MWVEIETTLFGVQRISGRTTHKVLVRIARTLSLLEPKVLKRNCSSVEEIQDKSSLLICSWDAEPQCEAF